MDLLDALAGFMLVLVGVEIFINSYRMNGAKHGKRYGLFSACFAVIGYSAALSHFAGN